MFIIRFTHKIKFKLNMLRLQVTRIQTMSRLFVAKRKSRSNNSHRQCDTLYSTDGAVAERSTDALRVVGSIFARNKYLYGLQVVVPSLAVCVCDFLCL